MQRTIAWSLTAAVVVAALALLLTMWLGGGATSDDAAAAEPTSAPATAPTPPPAPVVSPAPSEAEPSAAAAPSTGDTDTDSSRVGTTSALLSDVEATQEPEPVSLDIASIGVADAPIDPVGIEPDNSMEIPEDIRRIGWYEYGPSPGEEEGSAVLTAHIDSRTQGRGVFYDLDDLDPEEIVTVAMSDGSVREFAVLETRQIPKVDLPTGDLFRRDGEPVLALITCGGEFDESSRHYQDNIVVLASPIG